MNRFRFALCAFILASASLRAAEPIPGVGPAGAVTKLHTGFKFTEGPVADGDGNLYFTDIPNDRIHKVDADGKLSTILEKSEGCNGLMLDARGRLVACQGGAKRLISIDLETKKVAVLSDASDGKPLGTPNDLVIDRTGGVYFTAPDVSPVFYLPPAGKAVRVLDGLARPNGVLLGPDEKTLIVLPSGSADVLAYPIERPGTVGKAKLNSRRNWVWLCSEICPVFQVIDHFDEFGCFSGVGFNCGVEGCPSENLEHVSQRPLAIPRPPHVTQGHGFGRVLARRDVPHHQHAL